MQTSRRFAAIADIHGNSAALDAVLADIRAAGVTKVVNLGDCLSGPLDPAGTAARLMDAGFPTVRGNHDRWLYDIGDDGPRLWEAWTLPHLTDAQLDWVRGFPQTQVLGDVFLCHGTPTSDQTYWLHALDADDRMSLADREYIEAQGEGIAQGLILCAHTHLQSAVRLADGRLVVNPGSVGCPAYFDDRPPRPHMSTAGSPDARYALLEQGADAWRVSFRVVPYDAGAMIARAEAMGQHDWAEALATGWITPPGS